jgi:hypothetical protein
MENRKAKQVLPGGLVSVGGGEDVRKGLKRINVMEILLCMYVNGKMRPVETVLGMGRVESGRMMDGVNPTMMYCKNLCKYQNNNKRERNKL